MLQPQHFYFKFAHQVKFEEKQEVDKKVNEKFGWERSGPDGKQAVCLLGDSWALVHLHP